MSEEQKAKLRGRVVSKETRAKMRAAKAGRTLTAEHRAKIGQALRGRSHSAETLEKMQRRRGARVGKTLNVHGYVMVYAPEHPRAPKSNGRVPEHVLVMEQTLGRPLARGEVVHHVNHNRTDNRPENLQLMTRSEHAKIHEMGGAH